MTDLLKRLLFISFLMLFLTIAALVLSLDASHDSAQEPPPAVTPSATTRMTPTPSRTPTPIPSPTASPTFPPDLVCSLRYGEQSVYDVWGDGAMRDTTPIAGEALEAGSAWDISISHDYFRTSFVWSSNSSFAMVSAPSAMDSSHTHSALASTGDGFQLGSLFTPEVQFWSSDIFRWAAMYGLDPDLVATVMQIESCGHPTLVSYAGATGLFQVMPFHFSYSEDPFDPETNARRGLSLLRNALELSYGETELALAIYNGGTAVILNDPPDWPSETRNYVTWGIGILSDARSGNSKSIRLQAWLDAGGNALCLRSCLYLIAHTVEGRP